MSVTNSIHLLKVRVINYLNNNHELIKQHFVGWGIFYLIDFCFVFAFTEDDSKIAFAAYFSTMLLYISSFYTIVSIFDKELTRNRFLSITAAVAVLLFASLFNMFWNLKVLHFQASIMRFEKSPFNLLSLEIWRFSTALLYAFAYWIYLQHVREQKKLVQTEKQLHKAEIDFLKAQINPHFLFNTLNFVYYDISAISKNSGQAIMGLTKLLRYTVESSKSELSVLKKEIDAIEEYLALQKIRFKDKLQVRFKREGMFMFLAFPPLILMSMVENAFKYGIIDDPDNPIDIELKANPDNLFFRCKNLIRLDFKDKETTAVGVDNIIRRMDIFYDNRYDIKINQDEKTYEVILNVRWKS